MTNDLTVHGHIFRAAGAGYACDKLNSAVDRVVERAPKRPWRAKIDGAYIMNKSGLRPRTFISAQAAAKMIIGRQDPQAAGKRVAKRALTGEQVALLRKLRSIAGIRWREAIRRHWAGESPFRYSDMTDDERAILQGLRNSHGPRWMERFVLD